MKQLLLIAMLLVLPACQNCCKKDGTCGTPAATTEEKNSTVGTGPTTGMEADTVADEETDDAGCASCGGH
jgi:hypothetical protein